jgi:predicted transcriptional regulator
MSATQRLGELQLAILRVLWDLGQATATQVRDALPNTKQRALTTIATMLTKMEKRGVVDHRLDGRQFIWSARVTEEEVTRSMVAELTRKLFEGDVTALVSHLLTEQEIDRKELARLRKLIAAREREEPDHGHE